MKLGAVRYEPGDGPAIDALLTGLAHQLKREGYKLAGAVQSNTRAADRSRCEMLLEDLASGLVVRVSEDRGNFARGCRLDSGALEESAGLALGSLEPAIDLVIINRFGKREAEGRGLRPVIETAVVAGKPVLVGVSAIYWPSWQVFAGHYATVVPANECELLRWCKTALEDTRSLPLA